LKRAITLIIWPLAASLLGLSAIALLFRINLAAHSSLVWNQGFFVDALLEINIAIIGIALTIIAFVLQLAAQRTSSKIIDLFMQDPVNRLVFFLMVVSTILSMLIRGKESSAMEEPLHALPFALTLVCVVIIVPYFRYVLLFLQPRSVIDSIHKNMIRDFQRQIRPDRISKGQEEMALAIERIADIGLNALQQNDRNTTLHIIEVFERIYLFYIYKKLSLPDSWFQIPKKIIPSVGQDFYEEILERRSWLEIKIFLELEQIFKKSLDDMNDITSKIAEMTKDIGVRCHTMDEEQILDYQILFMNTYLRHSLNRRNIRAAYIILYHYRHLTICILEQRPAIFVRIMEHYKYYAHLANSLELPFLVVTVALDMVEILQHAYTRRVAETRRALEIFLDLDQTPDSQIKEFALRGVRKAQIRLAAHLLEAGDETLLEIILQDLSQEQRERVASIQEEMLSYKEKNFWEISERRASFDFISDRQKEFVAKIFDRLKPQG